MTGPPAPNKQLLRDTMDDVLAHPDLHCQTVWAVRTDCGTAGCFALWSCLRSGYQVDFDRTEDECTVVYLTNGVYIQHQAQLLLGLDSDTAEELFSAFNSVSDLKAHVDEICEHGLIRAAQTVQVTE